MESKIKELLLPYFHQRTIDSGIEAIQLCVNEVILDLPTVDIYEIGKYIEKEYLHYVDYDLLKGLESIKKELQNKQ